MRGRRGDDVASGTCGVGEVAAASAERSRASRSFDPPGVVPGRYRVLVVSDRGNAVIERDETGDVTAAGAIVVNTEAAAAVRRSVPSA